MTNQPPTGHARMDVTATGPWHRRRHIHGAPDARQGAQVTAR
jgi:hypothetical protein